MKPWPKEWCEQPELLSPAAPSLGTEPPPMKLPTSEKPVSQPVPPVRQVQRPEPVAPSKPPAAPTGR